MDIMDIKQKILQIKQELCSSSVVPQICPMASFGYVTLPGVEEMHVLALSDEMLNDGRLWENTCVALYKSDIESSDGILNNINSLSTDEPADVQPDSTEPTPTETPQSAGKWPCGVCKKGVGMNSIQCTVCQFWIHKRCTGVKSKLSKVSNFRCSSCTVDRTAAAEDPKTGEEEQGLLPKSCIHTCGKCHMKFPSVGKLRNHLYTHRKYTFRCEHCHFSFIFRSYLEKHKLSCAGKVKKVFKCAKCPMHCCSNRGLRRHLMCMHSTS